MKPRRSARKLTRADADSHDAQATASVHSFGPLLGERPRLLILGSMPGIASLDAQGYYAHPRNAFWPIVIAWLDGSAPNRERTIAIPYAERCQRLKASGIALWDVLGSCERAGSLDSAIVRKSERANDLAGLIARVPTLARIVFNGRAAEQAFTRHIGFDTNSPTRITAPSTSPAMAALDLPAKHRIWCDALAG